MNKKIYSQILDDVAIDHLPAHQDLAPTIINRIQKGRGFHMQPKTKLVSAILLVAITFVVLFYTVPGVSATIGQWFGYVPGVGLVREGQVRALGEPVSVTREGVTITVEQVVLNQERTVLLYSVDGIPGTAQSTQPEERCEYWASLRLPDGTPLVATPDGIQSWDSGYQHRFNFAPVPAAINDVKLVIPCLFHTRSGAAPENWEIPLHFVPAPPDITAFPVIEISTPTDEPVTPTAIPVEGSIPGTSTPGDIAPVPAALTLTLDRAVQMDDGYLLYATLHWENTGFQSVDVTNPNDALHLLDGSGQEMAYEIQYDELTGVNWDARKTTIAIKTAPVQSTDPLTLVVDWVTASLPVETSFVFDPGPNPEKGQEWRPNLEVKLGEQILRIRTVSTDGSGYSFEMSSTTGIQTASLGDAEHQIVSGYEGETGDNGDEHIFFSAFNYAEGLPQGPVTVTVGSIGVKHTQHLKAQWTPPAPSTTILPTQPAACLTAETWQTSLNQPPAIPTGLPGKVLTYGPADINNPTGRWEIAISALDGSQRQPIAGAQSGALSPDGMHLAYSSTGAGISIKDLASGETSPIPGTVDGDFNPFWSPDSKQIVFNRGNGVFDLFITAPDGSGLRQLTQGGVQEWPVGWMPDGSFHYIVPGRENEYTIYRLNLQSGESQEFARENILSISPDGKHMAISETPFGNSWQVSISDVDGANRWVLSDGEPAVMAPLWSPDGKWLLVTVRDGVALSGGLINLQTCQVIPLPNLAGSILSWVP